jgi:hypothetical protein
VTFAGLALVLTAAFLHATWNLFAKRTDGGVPFVWLCATVASVLWAPAALAVLLIAPPAIGATALPFLAGSAVLHTGYSGTRPRSRGQGDLALVSAGGRRRRRPVAGCVRARPGRAAVRAGELCRPSTGDQHSHRGGDGTSVARRGERRSAAGRDGRGGRRHDLRERGLMDPTHGGPPGDGSTAARRTPILGGS